MTGGDGTETWAPGVLVGVVGAGAGPPAAAGGDAGSDDGEGVDPVGSRCGAVGAVGR